MGGVAGDLPDAAQCAGGAKGEDPAGESLRELAAAFEAAPGDGAEPSTRRDHLKQEQESDEQDRDAVSGRGRHVSGRRGQSAVAGFMSEFRGFQSEIDNRLKKQEEKDDQD